MTRLLLHVGLAGAVFFLGEAALLAQTGELEPLDEDAPGNGRWAAPSGSAGLGLQDEGVFRAWGEVGLHVQDRLTVLTPTLGLGVRVDPSLELELILPIVYTEVTGAGVGAGEGPSKAVVANPTLGAHYATSAEGTGRARIGYRVSFPVSDQESSPATLERAAIGLSDTGTALTGLVVRGLQDAYLYFPNVVGFAVPARYERDLGNFTVGMDALAGVLVATTRDNDANHQFIAELAPTGAVWLAGNLVFGLRLPIATIPTLSGDSTQVSIEPYASFMFEWAFLAFRVNMPLDEPFGPFTDSDKAWGLFLGLGVNP